MGPAGANADVPFIEIATLGSGLQGRRSVVRFGRHAVDTTGFLGLSGALDDPVRGGFPAWATLPGYQDRTTGWRWHLFFAWVLVLNGALYLLCNAASGHFPRDLWPTVHELVPNHVWSEVKARTRLRWTTGEADKSYNVLQKLTYLSATAVALPMILVSGLTMSPGFGAIAPWLLDVPGGRQSARTLHFLAAAFIVGAMIVHVALVLLAVPWNLMCSMVTGR